MIRSSLLSALAAATLLASPGRAQPQPKAAAQPDPGAPAAGISPDAATSAAEAGPRKTAELWEARCAKCHGRDGKADTQAGRKFHIEDFTTAKWQKEMSDDEVRDTIVKGVRGKDKRVQMPAFKDRLTPEEIGALVAYVRAFGSK
jgi:mono/diheme cytochrome c family protein